MLGRDWKEGLPWLILAARDQETTGFSPSELVFGHSVRGLLAVLKDNWVDSEPPKTLVDFAKTRIKDTKHCEFSFKGPCLGAVANCAISFSGPIYRSSYG